MHIDSKEQIAGVPILEIRKLLRRHAGFAWRAESAARTLDVSLQRADEILTELEQAGFVSRRSSSTDDGLTWEVELKGRRLAKAGAGPRYHRARAEKHLKMFQKRVLELRYRHEYLHKVRRAILFGSFLDEEQDRVSDVDLAVDLQFKEPNRKTALARSEE